MIDSLYKKDKNYYPQVFLEENKYVVKEKKKSKFITDHIENFTDDSDKANFRLCKFPFEMQEIV